MLKNIEKLKELKEIKKIDYLISTEDNEIYADPFINGNILETYEILKKYSKEFLLSFIDIDYIIKPVVSVASKAAAPIGAAIGSVVPGVGTILGSTIGTGVQALANGVKGFL